MATITDKFGKVSSAGKYGAATTVKAARRAGEAVLSVVNAGQYASDTPVFFLTYKKTIDPNTNKEIIRNKKSWKGIVNPDNNTIAGLKIADGYTDEGNEIGDYVELAPTEYWANDLVDGILEHANPDGTLKSIAAHKALEGATNPATGLPMLGWKDVVGDNWAYNGFSNGVAKIDVNRSMISHYPRGARVRFRQGDPKTVKYGVVGAKTASSISLFMLNKATFDNSAVQDIAVSYEYSPKNPDNVDLSETSHYSLSEVPTGTMWIDGRQIYSKTFNMGGLKNAAVLSIPHNISDLDFIVSINGTAKNTDGGLVINLPHVADQQAYMITLYATDTHINIQTYTNQSSYTTSFVTLKYVKKNG